MSETHTGFEVPSGCPDIVTLGTQLWGEPTKRAKDKVEFGKRGSKHVCPAPENTWFDHEANSGGGYVELYKLKHGKAPDPPGFPIPPGMVRELGNPVAWWDYHNAHCQTIARVVRFHPPGSQDKTYRQCRPDGDRWRWKMQGLQIPLYHLPDLLKAPAGSIVYITEGEKHADLLRQWGLLATTNAGGAKKFRADHAVVLARFECLVLPDNDEAGREHRDVVTNALRAAGCQSIRVVDLPNLPPKGDVIDWAKAGGTVEALEEIVARSSSASRPDADDENEITERPETAVAPTRSNRRSVRNEFDSDGSSTDGPTIRVIAGQLHLTTTAAEDALIAAGLPIYQRGDGLVQPITREVPASRGRMTLAAGLGELTVPSVLDVMCATARYEKFDARAEEWIRINPPQQIAQVLLSRQGKWRFPVVAGIITTPTLRPDGSLLTAPGYDTATRLYHVADPSLRLHPEVHTPTRNTAERALKLLLGLLQEFSFVKLERPGKPDLEVAKAVALSALITPAVRGAMSVAPLHAINAHAPGSGKTFLVDLASLITTGRPCPVITAAPDEAETEKRVAGLLLAGYPIVSIDNCNGELGGDLLCQAVERPLIRIRRLGGSDITEIESAVTMFATGNNLRVRGDMVRRSLVAELDPQVERPELREFKHDPVAAILGDRGKFVSACLIIVRAYILARSPGKLAPIASFEGWSDLVRSALVWLGCADPALSMEAAREDDPELGELREVLAVWSGAFGSDALTTKEIADKISTRLPTQMGEPTDFTHPELRDALLRLAGTQGTLNTRRLGQWLLSKSGRIVGNQRLVKAGSGHGGLTRWAVRSMVQK